MRDRLSPAISRDRRREKWVSYEFLPIPTCPLVIIAAGIAAGIVSMAVNTHQHLQGFLLWLGSLSLFALVGSGNSGRAVPEILAGPFRKFWPVDQHRLCRFL